MQHTLFDILKKAGLSREEILKLDEKELIRVEKKIKAAQQLKAGILPHEAERVLEALKRHLAELKQFYSNEVLYMLFHDISFKERDHFPFFMKGEGLEKMQAFFTAFIEEDLLAHFRALLEKNQFQKLMRWQMAQLLFSAGFRHGFNETIKGKLQLILDILTRKAGNWEFREKIPYAKSKHFYRFLDKIRDPGFDELIRKILSFYAANKDYTKGKDFHDSILVAMYEYKPNDEKLQGYITLTALSAGGSNKVGVIAFAVIVGILLVIALCIKMCHKANRLPPGAYVPQTEWDQQRHKMNVRNMLNDLKRKRYNMARTYEDTACQRAFRNSDDLIRFESAATGFDYDVSTDVALSTGDETSSGKIEKRRTSDSMFAVLNNTGQPMFIHSYHSYCYYPEWEAYYPCKYPYAYGRVYVEPGDTLFLDYHLDSFAIQTGTVLYRLSKRYEGGTVNTAYAFCPVTIYDSLLSMATFQVFAHTEIINGIFEISRKKDSYSVEWQGKNYALIYRKNGKYMEKGKPLLFGPAR